MKYLKSPFTKQHHHDRTVFPAVIGYNRLLTDNKPTHKFLKEIGVDQTEANYEQLIGFTQRFLNDLHKVDHHAYRILVEILHKHNKEEKETDHEKQQVAKDCHHQICTRIKQSFSKD